MKIKTTKSELYECIINAFTRLINEGKSFKDSNWSKKSNSDQRKRTKMEPQRKEKYNNKHNWNNYNEND